MNMKNVLVLGTSGLVGSSIYKYLRSFDNTQIWGTSRSIKIRDKNILPFTVENPQDAFRDIIKQVKNIDYIINCIGKVQPKDTQEEMISINALFPHKLASLAEEYNCNVIHISTDGVYASLAGKVNESIRPFPLDMYGMTKLLGESQSKGIINIRTSFLGFDSENHKGLLEKVMIAKKTFPGYIDQHWSGCTTLQFAQLCNKIINENLFDTLRNNSAIYHFAPLVTQTKYAIVKEFSKIKGLDIKIEKIISDKPLTRVLTTKFNRTLFLNEYEKDLHNALKELINYEKNY